MDFSILYCFFKEGYILIRTYTLMIRKQQLFDSLNFFCKVSVWTKTQYEYVMSMPFPFFS